MQESVKAVGRSSRSSCISSRRLMKIRLGVPWRRVIPKGANKRPSMPGSVVRRMPGL